MAENGTEPRDIYLGKRLDDVVESIRDLRDAVSDVARGLHEHLNKMEAAEDPAWWIAPAKTAIYVVLAVLVLVLAGRGVIELESVQEMLKGWMAQ